jgi:hypothetical protein
LLTNVIYRAKISVLRITVRKLKIQIRDLPEFKLVSELNFNIIVAHLLKTEYETNKRREKMISLFSCEVYEIVSGLLLLILGEKGKG